MEQWLRAGHEIGMVTSGCLVIVQPAGRTSRHTSLMVGTNWELMTTTPYTSVPGMPASSMWAVTAKLIAGILLFVSL